MPKLKALVQKIGLSFIKFSLKISKRMYRTCAIITTGVGLVAVFNFSDTSFAGAGKNVVFFNVFEGLADKTDIENESDEKDMDNLEFLLETTNSEESQNIPYNLGLEILTNNLVREARSREADEKVLQEKIDILKIEVQEYQAAKEEARKKAELMEARKQAFNMKSFTDEDYNNLVRIVEAEVGDNDIYGKQIVANVILNRVMSSKFPDTVTEVIFQKNQFTPTFDGRYYKVKIADSTIQAVELALNGEDNSRGALYFMDRKTASKKNVAWFDANLNNLFYYGGHEYFK